MNEWKQSHARAAVDYVYSLMRTHFIVAVAVVAAIAFVFISVVPARERAQLYHFSNE